MNKIQLLYVENVITRKKRSAQQQLSFFMVLENLGFDKQVDVIWRGEDAVWHTLPASFHSHLQPNKEYWLAQITREGSSEQSLPGNIEFALRYQCSDQEVWDNNESMNYSSQADSGIVIVRDRQLQNIDFCPAFHEGQKYLPVTVAVDQSLHAQKVTIHWTTDNWLSSHKTSCHFKRNYWDKAYLSNARNPNQYGVELWKGWLKVANAFHVQYSIACESQGQVLWENNTGTNYSVSRSKPLTVLILNLHCYQEDNQDYKFSQIARAIDERQVDIVCLQEVAELWNDGLGNFETNSAKIINDRLAQPFLLYTDWSHLGFDKYREGVAILSRYPIIRQDSKYVSDTHDVYSIHSRKVVMAQIFIPFMGLINVFSAHLSWWEDGFAQQFSCLRDWADSEQSESVKATLLCGDFNIAAGSTGYRLVVDAHEYEDQFLAANAHGVFEKVFRVNDPYWQNYLAEDYRIDYIFLNKNNDFRVTSGEILFTEHDYGRVSDHCGYLMTFEPGRN
ncbi:MAG: endonuclease [Methylococcaceae bacterium]|nr:endonuclease [Methylococcaceae bacterium]